MVHQLFDDTFLGRLEKLEIFTRNINTLYYESGYQGHKKSGEVEFADYKPYSPGDDVRYIDWNVYGRLDTYVTKLFGAEEKKRTNILLDVSGSMGLGRKSVLSVQLGAALAAIGLFSGDTVDIALFGSKIQSFSGVKNERSAVFSIFNFLADVSCSGETDYIASFREFARVKKEPSRLILISDFWSSQSPERHLNILKDAETETSCIQILNEEEISPRSRGILRLRDAENGDEVSMDVTGREIQMYQKKMEARLERIRNACLKNDMDYVLMKDTISLEEAVFGILRNAGIVY